jgi:Domain of unknown function (DUF4259)
MPQMIETRHSLESQSARLRGYRWSVEAWGTGSFENEAASDWFYLVEEAVDPGPVIGSALDDALAEAGYLELDAACAAVAAAELLASCAGEVADDLPDHIRRWVGEHPHQPHADEIGQAVQAIERVRSDSELRELWDEERGPDNAWLLAVDDLVARLGRSGTDVPAALRP